MRHKLFRATTKGDIACDRPKHSDILVIMSFLHIRQYLSRLIRPQTITSTTENGSGHQTSSLSSVELDDNASLWKTLSLRLRDSFAAKVQEIVSSYNPYAGR